jgi:hypothetical protein
MRIPIVKILLLCSILLCSTWFYAQESGQTDKKIVVLFKGNSKSTAAPVALDGMVQGELPNETYLVIPAKDGSHDVTVGKQDTHAFKCNVESMSGNCTSGGATNSLTLTFYPVTLKVDLSEGATTYVQVEPFKPEGCCTDIGRIKLVDYKVRVIKAKDGEKLMNKYKAMPAK